MLTRMLYTSLAFLILHLLMLAVAIGIFLLN